MKDIDYDEKYKSEVKELETRYDSLGTDCTFRVVNDYVNGKSFCCDNNEVEVFNRPDTENGNSEEAGIFFYHPDHLGSTAMVTDHEGRITQNVVYIPFGEVFLEQRDGNWNTPYLFNAKELDEETGLYYYGARYLDPSGAQWLSVDPLFEKYAGMSPYNYCAGNPVKFIDPDGRIVVADKQSQKNIYNTVSREESKYIKFDKNGFLNDRLLSKCKNVSKNIEALKSLSKSDFTYCFQVRNADHNGKKYFDKGDNVHFYRGTTEFPKAANNPSPDDKIYIIVGDILSSLQQTKTTAHEAYGHAFFYETKNQNIEAACHTYTIVDGGSYYDEDYDMEIPILKQVPTNIELELQIENVVNEAEFNYKEHNE